MRCFRTGTIQSDFEDLTRCLCVRGRSRRPQQTLIHTPYAHSSHSRIFASKASEIPGETTLRVAFQFPFQPFLRLDHCLSRIARIKNVKRHWACIQTSTSCTFFPWITSSFYWHFETKIAWFWNKLGTYQSPLQTDLFTSYHNRRQPRWRTDRNAWTRARMALRVH